MLYEVITLRKGHRAGSPDRAWHGPSDCVEGSISGLLLSHLGKEANASDRKIRCERSADRHYADASEATNA